MVVPRAASLLPLVLALGCGGPAADDGRGDAAGDAGPADAPDAAPRVFSGIDVLFVVNDSGGMRPAQERLGEHMAALFDRLGATLGELPSLHVGVVSTSVEDPESPGAYCPGDRGGELRPGACLSNGAAFASTTAHNFAGTIAEAAACMAQLGDLGCPFEQPLEAMRRALADDATGFVRDDALLAVVLVTDEDDCSSPDPRLYASGSFPYGVPGSFRCFEFGVRCDEPDPAAPGPHTGCVADEDGALYPVAEYVDFLEQHKGAGGVVVEGLVPPEGPVEVIVEPDGRRVLGRLCPEAGEALQTWPTIRLHAFARALTTDDDLPLGQMCAADWSDELQRLAQRIADAYRG